MRNEIEQVAVPIAEGVTTPEEAQIVVHSLQQLPPHVWQRVILFVKRKIQADPDYQSPTKHIFLDQATRRWLDQQGLGVGWRNLEQPPRSMLWNVIQQVGRVVTDEQQAPDILQKLATYDQWEWLIKSHATAFWNSESERVTAANKRAIGAGLAGTLTLDQWRQTLQLFRRRCAYCQRPFSYQELDHVIPLKAGLKGTTADNSVPACRFCNRAKGAWKFEEIQYRIEQHTENRASQPTLPPIENPQMVRLGEAIVQVHQQMEAFWLN